MAAPGQRAFRFFGGVTEMIVPNNLKAGILKAGIAKPHRYEPDINPTYAEMCAVCIFLIEAVIHTAGRGRVQSGRFAEPK